MEPSHEQLLQWLYASAQGNKQAFESLYEATSGKLFSVCLHLMRRKEWAEDVLQDAYVRIWHNAIDYHADKGSVMSWMISIARYRALDVLKAQRVRSEHLGVGDSNIDREDEDMPVGEAIGLARDKSKLDDCMQGLTKDHRQSIQLAFFNGLSHQEITHFTGSPLGSVKSWVRRGLMLLRRCLDS